MGPCIKSKPSENETVTIALFDGKGKGQTVKMPAQDAGTVASSILLSALMSSANKSFPKGASLQGVVGLKPTAIGLADDDTNHVNVVVHMGLARFALHLEQTTARELGTALVAATATRDQPH